MAVEETAHVLPKRLGAGPHGIGKLIRLVNFQKSNMIYKVVFIHFQIISLLCSVLITGDPDDKFLRKVEKEVLIPKIMRDRAKIEKCTEVVANFEKCCKASGLAMVVKCRKENSALQECLTKWYRDETFIEECTQIYLNERSEYRRTGITKKQKLLNAENQ